MEGGFMDMVLFYKLFRYLIELIVYFLLKVDLKKNS